MIRTRIAAAVAALALAVSGQASAEETTTVGYSTDLSAYINAIYRPGVTNVDVAAVVSGVTKAECKYDATGVGGGQIDDTTLVVLVAKVVTTATRRTGRPQDGVPVATGVGCELRNGDGTAVVQPWEALRPGNAAYNVVTEVITEPMRRPTICVWAWVYFGDGTRRDHPRRCESAFL